ncbi:uncharacterized protein LOC129250708 [Anastrepha obliqua]|uniref:uncharacterized protein LOC129250708 n=1 Tax=Anastrepha obliqua TaxID=95512 RepID=UPI00240A27BC|nr:uncharacterized protein LOC129250708 [Anastrepha obliqua]
MIAPILALLFMAAIRLNYIHKKWAEVKVVFIPKGGNTTLTKAKDFRPISLSSFLLKALERLLDMNIKEEICNKVSPSQHAYSKGKSVETALHALVYTVEKSLHYKENTLAAFLDIEGAFKYIYPEAITTSLTEMGVNRALVSFIERMLTGRTIIANLGDT